MDIYYYNFLSDITTSFVCDTGNHFRITNKIHRKFLNGKQLWLTCKTIEIVQTRLHHLCKICNVTITIIWNSKWNWYIPNAKIVNCLDDHIRVFNRCPFCGNSFRVYFFKFLILSHTCIKAIFFVNIHLLSIYTEKNELKTTELWYRSIRYEKLIRIPVALLFLNSR